MTTSTKANPTAVSRADADDSQAGRPANDRHSQAGRPANDLHSQAGRPANDHRSNDAPTLLPPVDVVEDAAGITLYADLPGVPKDRLQVRVDADALVIEGELALPTPQGMAASHAEVQVTRYRRTFTLSKELDAQKVDADFNHGVLRVRLPKSADAQPRRIEVRVG